MGVWKRNGQLDSNRLATLLIKQQRFAQEEAVAQARVDALLAQLAAEKAVLNAVRQARAGADRSCRQALSEIDADLRVFFDKQDTKLRQLFVLYPEALPRGGQSAGATA